jgi:exodeoxyribonuclease III
MPSFIAWNVNSLKNIVRNDNFHAFIKKESPTILGLGETKLNGSPKEEEFLQTLDAEFPEYPYKYYNTSKARKGYAGTAIWSKVEPISVQYDTHTQDHEHSQEGRVITLEFPKFYVVHVYTPNAGQDLKRHPYRVDEWDPDFHRFLKKLEKKKPVIIGGDLNVAHEDIDIFKPDTHHQSAGFTDEERANFATLLEDFVDTFRHKHPQQQVFTYWTYLFKARQHNRGWRIDYWLVSNSLAKKIKEATVYSDQLGSDHCPVGLVL